MPATVTETTSPAPATIPIIQKATNSNDDLSEKFQAVVRGNRSGTLKLQGIPEFHDLYEKREWIKGHMAAAFRFFGKQGYGEGVSGHISVRGINQCGPGSKIFRIPAMRIASKTIYSK